mmetsp:Transcript_35921/g.49852  ORF Transcript_35921/g.49852 Transcript_35921/m.49852 type:complete len:409 (+) Transcript_35921:131-1357(+)
MNAVRDPDLFGVDVNQHRNPLERQLVAYDDLVVPSFDPIGEEREKHQSRAERFGVDFREPNKKNLHRSDLKKMQYKREGFPTGIDFTSEEEKAKCTARASKFGSSLLGLTAEEAEKEEKKLLRKERFGIVDPEPVDVVATMDLDLLEARADAPSDASPRLEAVCLYGVDLLSSTDCLLYFSDYGPSYVEWINDSSCLVVFADEFSGERAVLKMGTRLPLSECKLDQVSSESLGELFCWHSGPDFMKNGVAVPLQFRLATSADVRQQGPARSRHLWQEHHKAGPNTQVPRGGGSEGAKQHKRKRFLEEAKQEAEVREIEAATTASRPPVIPEEALESGDLRRKIFSSDLRSRILRGGVTFFDESESEEEDGEMAMQMNAQVEERPVKASKIEHGIAKRVLKSIIQEALY